MTEFVLITCEHGGNRIPAPFRGLFRAHRALLETHRGWDPGALVVAKALAGAYQAPLVASTTSRLLIDLNRSIGHPQVFSSVTSALPVHTKAQIIDEHYRPYREKVEDLVRTAVSRHERVIHLSSHSFTPELDGVVREADIGLLYDPRRHLEVEISAHWKKSLTGRRPDLRVRRNYPYAGKADGLTSHLRKRFPPSDYVGIELEVNQRFVLAAGRPWTALRDVLIESLRDNNVQRDRRQP